MRIYAVADIHSKPHHIAAIFSIVDEYRPDLVVAAGDLTHFFNWKTCLSQLDSLNVPVFAIRGNTDMKWTVPRLNQARNITCLTSTPIDQQGISFLGTDGTLVLPFASRICFREEDRLAAFPPMGPDTVMVVHPPPRGVLDRVAGKFSAGSRPLARFIKKAGPGLVLCGHIHEQPGIATLGKSLVINCSMGKKSLGAVIDMEKGQPPRANLLQA